MGQGRGVGDEAFDGQNVPEGAVQGEHVALEEAPMAAEKVPAGQGVGMVEEKGQ